MNNNDLITILSRERLTKYLQKCGGDEEKAIAAYTQNTHISASFYPFLQGLEIALRNAIHSQLKCDYQEKWYDMDILTEQGKKEIEKTKNQLKYRKKEDEIVASDIIANLSFGFWVSLFDHGYEKIWNNSLNKIFATDVTLKTRKSAFKRLRNLRILRNKIAHHEPIIFLNLEENFKTIVQLTKTLSPAMADWVKQNYKRIK